MRVFARAALCATVSLMALSAALAQDGANQPAARQASIPGGDITLDEITVTATKTEEKAIDALAGVSTVSEQDIQRLQPSRISDVFLGMPGVTTQTTVQDPGQAINIRGMQDYGRVAVLIDGARQNYGREGHGANGTFYLDPELVGGIDVTRGPVSTIYGSGAIGGVASFRTRSIDDVLAEDEQIGAVQHLGAGTNGANFVNSTMVGARLGTAADIFGQFVWRNETPYRDGAGNTIVDTGSKLSAGNVKFNLRPADGHTISATALFQEYRFTNNANGTDGARFGHEVQTGNYTLGYRFQRPDVPWLDLSIKGYYVTTTDDQRLINPSSPYVASGARAGDARRFDVETTGVDIHNMSRFSTGSVDHAVTVGFDALRDHVTVQDQAGGFGSALTPSGNRRLTGAFIQDELRYGDWLRVIGALRYDSYKLDGGGYNSDGSRLSPKITIGISPIQGIELYGTYAEGYRAPTITETLVNGVHPFPAFNILPNPALKPEVARNWEAGVNVKYDGIFTENDKFRAKANVFLNNVSDYIDSVDVGTPHLTPIVPGMPAFVCQFVPAMCISLYDQQYQNIAKARLTGVEVEAAYDWGGGFISVAGTHINGKNKQTNGPLNSVMPDQVSTTLGLRFLDDKLTIGTRLTFVDDSKKNVTNPTKGYGLVDLFASYQYSDRIRGDIIIKNVFDRQYTQYLNSDASPGLTAKFGLTVKFAAK